MTLVCMLHCVACSTVEIREVAPVTTKPPVAGPKFALLGMTADVLSELRRKREMGKEAGKQAPAAREPEVI